MTSPSLTGLHHLKVPVSDLSRSLLWYEQVLGAQRNPDHDHRDQSGKVYAHILQLPGSGTLLELRVAPIAVQGMHGFDPVTYSIADRTQLQAWTNHLDHLGVEHSGELRGIVGWVLVFTDPDGLAIRLYTDEGHAFDEANADFGSPWLHLAPDDQASPTG